MSNIKDVMAGMPDMVRLTFAHYEPGDPQPTTPGETVQLAIDDPDPKKVMVQLGVSKPGWGFGSFTIIQTPEGICVDTELSGKDAVKAAFCELIDKALHDRETDPQRHALYNRITGTRCGPRCKVCYPDEPK